MTEYVVGIAVVLVIIVIAVVLSRKMTPKPPATPTAGAADATTAAVKSGLAPPASEAPSWTRDEATSYVWGQVAPGVSAPDGNAKFLGITGSAAECEDSCGKNPWCSGYTWHDVGTGGYDKMCYGVSHIRLKVGDVGRYSGEREGFSSTLSRRASLKGAGKDVFDHNGAAADAIGTFDAQHFVPAASKAAALAGTFDAYKQNFVPAASKAAALAGTFDAYKQNFTVSPMVAELANKYKAGVAGAADKVASMVGVQKMTSPDPAFGTMWGGQYKTAALPI